VYLTTTSLLFVLSVSDLYQLAKSRVYVSKKITRKRKAQKPLVDTSKEDVIIIEDQETHSEEGSPTGAEETVQVPILEENPKWQLLSNVLKEIESTRDSPECTAASPAFGEMSYPLRIICSLYAAVGGSGQTLVMVRDERTCMQLQEYLAVGGKPMYSGPPLASKEFSH